MTDLFRLFGALLGISALFACSDSAPPTTLQTAASEVEPAAAPASTPRSRPAGPHGQYDPHGSLDADRLIKVALQHDTEGRSELALQTLSEGIERYPDAARLYAVRASLWLRQREVSTALKDLERAVKLSPDDAEVRVNRAQAYRTFGRYDEAMTDLDHAVANAPDLLPARFNRGALLYATGQFDRALVDFEHCIAVDPHAAAPYFNRASTRWELGDSESALKDIQRFIELTDNDDWEQSARELEENWKKALADETVAG